MNQTFNSTWFWGSWFLHNVSILQGFRYHSPVWVLYFIIWELEKCRILARISKILDIILFYLKYNYICFLKIYEYLFALVQWKIFFNSKLEIWLIFWITCKLMHLRVLWINVGYPANTLCKSNVILWLYFGNLRRLLYANVDVT